MQITELSASRLRDCRIYLHATDQSQCIKQLQCIIICIIIQSRFQKYKVSVDFTIANLFFANNPLNVHLVIAMLCSLEKHRPHLTSCPNSLMVFQFGRLLKVTSNRFLMAMQLLRLH